MYNTDSVQNQTLLSNFDSIKVKPYVILNASQLYTIQAFVQKNLGGAILYSSLLKNMHGIKGIHHSGFCPEKSGRSYPLLLAPQKYARNQGDPYHADNHTGNRTRMAKRQISEQQHRKIYHLYKGLYAIVIPSEQTITCVLIDPDEKMLCIFHNSPKI